MNHSQTQRHRLPKYTAIVAAACLAGCQTQQSQSRVVPPKNIVVWEDPDTGDQGQTIRDANNDEDRFVVVGTNGRVQFLPGGEVCRACDTDIDNARIDLGDGHLVDLRFGVGAVGDDVRRLFLVDAASGNFIQLVGGGDKDVTFQVTTEPLEEPNDDSDDRALAAGEAPNPAAGESQSQSREVPLCGALGGPIMGLLVLLNSLVAWRRR